MIPKFHIMHVPGVDPERERIVHQQAEENPSGSCVHADPHRSGILRNWTGALMCANAEARQSGADWVLVGQDDAKPLTGWQENLIEVLSYAPAPIISLCHTADAGLRMERKSVSFAVGTHTLWGPMVAYRTEVLPRLIEVAQDVLALNHSVYNKWDDRIPGVHNLLHGGTTAVVRWALFDHPHLKSTVGNAGNQHRYPSVTIESSTPDWTLGTMPFWKKPNGLMLELAEAIR